MITAIGDLSENALGTRWLFPITLQEVISMEVCSIESKNFPQLTASFRDLQIWHTSLRFALMVCAEQVRVMLLNRRCEEQTLHELVVETSAGRER